MKASEPSVEDQGLQKRSRRLGVFFGYLVTMTGISIFCIHYFQFDVLAPVTLVPPWLWLIPAALLIAFSYRSLSRGHLTFAVLVWLTFVALFVEEARSLIRPNNLAQRTNEQHRQPSEIRVATLNCHVGSKKAAMEVMAFHPDIVLLQESPGSTQLAEIAESLFGGQSDFLSCGDTSILARGKLTPVMSDPSSHFTHALLTLPDGQQFDVVSLRLSPPVFQMNFWSSKFWKAHFETRRHHREQLQDVAKHLKKFHRSDHWIIGGDFNLVGNDGALDALRPLSDTFFRAGSGWGNTGTNDYPLFRVDQIWTNASLDCEGHRAIRTEHSDHRMVVVDLTLAE